MFPRDCPLWEYKDFPNAHKLLLERSSELLLHLRADPNDCNAVALDTRNAHAHLYAQLTPAKCDYYAGHYRGEPFRCLLNYRVGVPSDPLVGANPEDVLSEMAELETYPLLNSSKCALPDLQKPGNLCDDCFDIACEIAESNRVKFNKLRAAGVSRKMANEIMIAMIHGGPPS